MTKIRNLRKESQAADLRPTFIQRIIYNWIITDPNLNLASNKNYQVQNHEKMKYIYFFGGRWRTVKGRPISALTGVLIIVPGVLFWCYEAKWLWEHISPAPVIVFSYIWLLTFMFFIRTCTSDPGVLPRNIHLPLKVDKTTRGFTLVVPEEYYSIIMIPHDRDVEADDANGGQNSGEKKPILLKYCPTCHIWKPARTSHCNICNCCVLHHDHHCKFLNNCVGPRNYQYFLWFLLSATVSNILLFVLSYLQIFYYRTGSMPLVRNFGQSIYMYPAAFFLSIYSFFTMIYPALLLGFHVFLTSKYLTTREYLNNVWGKNYNPDFVNVFDTHSIWKNLYITWIGKPRGISSLRLVDPYEPGDLRLEKVEPLPNF